MQYLLLPRWVMLITTILLLEGCAKVNTKPIFIHSKYNEIRPSILTLLPIQDHRVNKEDDADIQDIITKSLIPGLRSLHYRYEIIPVSSNKEDLSQTVTVEQIKKTNLRWLNALGTNSSRWVLIVAVEHLESSFLLLQVSSLAKVHGYLFDKVKGVLIWEGVGSGQGSAGFLIATYADDLALAFAVGDMISTLPERK